MVININEFGQTLAIGALAILFIYLVVFRLLNEKIGRFISETLISKSNISNVVLGTFFLALLYVAGITIEEVARGEGSKHLKSIIPSESFDCQMYLLKVYDKNNKEIKRYDNACHIEDAAGFSASHLLLELYHSGMITKLQNRKMIFAEPGFCLEQFTSLEDKVPITDKKKFKADYDRFSTFATQLLYIAKNEVFRETNYFDELRTIESRMHFSRSLVFLSIGIALVVIIMLIWWLISICHKRSRKSYYKESRKYYGNKFWILFIIIISTITIFFSSERSYLYERKQYCQRVFGYFVSIEMEQNKALPDIQGNEPVMIFKQDNL